jgi:hypothetical protein
MGEDKRKHLELIQNTVSRMAGNLFYLRGWSVTIIGGVLAFLSTQKDKAEPFPVIVLLVVTVMFWMYDGYFLALERKYRDLYGKVRSMPEKDIDFSMDVSEFNKLKKNSQIYCMFSKTIAPFYILFIVGALYVLIRGVV